jgi:hypothetical protein
VRRLIARQSRGEPITMGEVWRVCCFRTLLYATRNPGTPPPPDTPLRAAVTVLNLDATPETLSERMRQDVEAALDAGAAVLLLSNSRAQRDATKRELGLTMCAPMGSA